MHLKRLLSHVVAGLALAQMVFGQKAAAPDNIAGNYLERFLLLPAADHTDAQLKELAVKFSNDIHLTYRVGVLWVFPKQEHLYSILGLRATHSPFADWRNVWIDEAHPVFPVCRITVLGKNAVLEKRHEDGTVSRIVVEGRDPLLITASGFEFTVSVLIGGRVHDRTLEYSPSCKVKFEAYLFVERVPSAAFHMQLWNALRRELQSPCVSYQVRTDYWFRGFGVPTVFPFAKPVTPTQERFFAGDVAGCVSAKGGVFCSFLDKGEMRNQRYSGSTVQ